ncbi:hypothetical protein QE152_g10393 [Popillia japonica]|uniref:Uncharacterized protein n=1 Tax=Popillia japonica TaxID=7064 RepID=A0AAW1LRN0_POPJA
MIRFSVMLMFCRTECPQVDCGYFSNNRIKRDVLLQDLNANNGTQVKSVKKNYFDKIGKEIVKESYCRISTPIMGRKLKA